MGPSTDAFAARLRPGGRIAIFVPSLRGGGAERAMVNLARGMHELGHAVDLVVGTTDGPYRDEIKPGIGLVDLEARRMSRALPGLVSYLRRERPAVLYSAMDHANVVALCALRLAAVPARAVVSLREMPSRKPAGGLMGLRQRALRLLARALYPLADGVIAVSGGVADDASSAFGLDRRRIAVLTNPVLIPEIQAQAKADLAHPWFAAGEPPVVLACGRLSEEKDYPTLLRAFAEVRRQRPARLVILGEGPERAALLRLAEALGIDADLALPGFDANPFRFMARARVFALSSTSEGQPNVVIQALACGPAVVATDCGGGTREILEGVEGTSLIPVGDAAAMAGAIAAFLHPTIPHPGSRFLERFDYRTAAAGYLAVAGA